MHVKYFKLIYSLMISIGDILELLIRFDTDFKPCFM